MRASPRATRLFVVVLALLLVSCRSTTATPPQANAISPTPVQTPTAQPASDEEAIRQLILAESEAVVQQDIDRLAQLWVEKALVRDANHTPDDDSDDAVWRGLDAVLDRYMTIVFPGNPQFAAPEIIQIIIEGDVALVRSTTRIGQEVSPAGDRWEFERQRDGGWRIRSLIYNLEPIAP
ncbi:MAG: DUF4440 domain-containing protein [Chloroflexi bacterium]|nr:DUF4440 domain-containing protein [Chloroflexota bacterium]